MLMRLLGRMFFPQRRPAIMTKALRSESPWIKFPDVGERSTFSTLKSRANDSLANDFVFQQIADEAPGFPLACQLHLPTRTSRSAAL